ncbi:hypothetical protein QUD70_08225 [Leuconostoc citreum]|nr:hypothetical protein [Leuconostoc citreum]MDM7642376.1 hypothetical protein [Leuconostoc citreum]
MSIIPKKLKVGDQIRVISPSSSIDRVGGFEDKADCKIKPNTLHKKTAETLMVID